MGKPPPDTRSIELEQEVPGTPEEVWEAVATGPGISAWFVPATVEPRAGGAMTLHFGPGMDEQATVVDWEPPRRFTYSTAESRGRTLTYTFTIDALGSGAACRVGLVNDGFGAEGEWDRDLEAMGGGWALFLTNLALSREHFPGERCTSLIVNGAAQGRVVEVLDKYLAALGVRGSAKVGDAVATDAGRGAPVLRGTVVRRRAGMLTLLAETPSPGIVFLAAEGGGERVFTSFYGYFFGAEAQAAVAVARPQWREWMAAHFS